MNSKPVFQFSALDKSYYARLQKAIRKLDGNYDTSKLYSTTATHLIIDKIICTEKILCFIASGKWIVTQSYIKDCLKESKFLDESNFQISIKFPNSRLAQITNKWMKKIKLSTHNYPFHGWDVAIFVEDYEKARALSRIIRAGFGNFACLGKTNRFNRSFQTRFSLVIYDAATKSQAIEFAKHLNIKFYPFQCIPDYLIQGIKSAGPILSIEYYENFFLSPNNSISNKENIETYNNDSDIAFDNDKNLNNFFIYLSKSNKKTNETLFVLKRFLDSTINDHFMNLWSNKAYYEAFFVLSKIEVDSLPSSRLITELFEFLLTKPSSIKKFLKLKSNEFQSEDSIYFFLYHKILTFLTLKILNFPSLTNERFKYFNQIFKNLIMEFRIYEIKQEDLKSTVDVLYLICIHDFLIINSDCNTKNESVIQNLNLNDSKNLISLVEKILKDKNPNDPILVKLIEIFAFINNYIGKLKFYQKIQKKFLEICSNGSTLENSLRCVFMSSLNELKFK